LGINESVCATCWTPRLNLSSELCPSWNNIQDTFLTGSATDTTNVSGFYLGSARCGNIVTKAFHGAVQFLQANGGATATSFHILSNSLCNYILKDADSILKLTINRHCSLFTCISGDRFPVLSFR